MTISQALSNASAGLSVVSRASAVVSANLANTMTQGYARQEIQLSSVAGTGTTGVRVSAVVRDVDPALTADRLRATSAETGTATTAAYLQKLEKAFGTSDAGDSLSGRIAQLSATLISAASSPSSESRLADVLTAAGALAEKINDLGTTLQTTRADSDSAIARDVDLVNENLARIDILNRNIVTQQAQGRDVNALLDERQRLVDGIAEILPVRATEGTDGRISLHTSGGVALLEGSRVALLEFSVAGAVTPATTIENGLLSGLTINGKSISVGQEGTITEGRLAANFAIRDTLAPQAQNQLDALARDLITRFEEAAETVSPGGAGLFADTGDISQPGTAGRLAIAAAYDPAQGGAVWHIRNGTGATAVNTPGEASGLLALSAALASSTTMGASTGSFADFAAGMLSDVSTRRLSADSEAGFRAAAASVLRNAESARGVNSDEELQKLLLIEQAYAANARVLQVADQMMQTLLEIG